MQNAKWSNIEIPTLMDKLVEQKSLGNTSENGFKQSVWKSIASSFLDALKNIPRVCESKWARLKKDYKDVEYLRDLSGGGWDDEEKLVILEKDVRVTMREVFTIYPYS